MTLLEKLVSSEFFSAFCCFSCLIMITRFWTSDLNSMTRITFLVLSKGIRLLKRFHGHDYSLTLKYFRQCVTNYGLSFPDLISRLCNEFRSS